MVKRLMAASIAAFVVAAALIGSVWIFSTLLLEGIPEEPQSVAYAVSLSRDDPSELTSDAVPDRSGSVTDFNSSRSVDIAVPAPSFPSSSLSSVSTAGVASNYAVILEQTALYAGPDFGEEQHGQIGVGNAVRLKACNPGCTWYQLETDDWIPAEVLSARPVDLPIVDPNELVATKPMVIAWPTVTPTPTPTPVPEWNGPTAKEYAILRRGPGTVYERVSVVAPGTPMHVVAQNSTGDWYQLENGAWVAAFLLDKSPKEPLPVAQNIPPRPEGARDLEVTFSSPWYACHQSSTKFSTPLGEEILQWVYRSFRITMSIRNLNTAPVLPVYKPTRWIITDGFSQFVETTSWVEPSLRPPAKRQRILYYDDSSLPETWYLLTLRREQWVKAVEFEWNGEIYRAEFSLEEAKTQQNYKDCGAARNVEN